MYREAAFPSWNWPAAKPHSAGHKAVTSALALARWRLAARQGAERRGSPVSAADTSVSPSPGSASRIRHQVAASLASGAAGAPSTLLVGVPGLEQPEPALGGQAREELGRVAVAEAGDVEGVDRARGSRRPERSPASPRRRPRPSPPTSAGRPGRRGRRSRPAAGPVDGEAQHRLGRAAGRASHTTSSARESPTIRGQRRLGRAARPASAARTVERAVGRGRDEPADAGTTARAPPTCAGQLAPGELARRPGRASRSAPST